MDRPGTELAILVAALFSSGGLITLLLHRWWKQQDDAAAAYRYGVSDGEQRCIEQLTEVRRQALEDRARCDVELAKLRNALVVIMRAPSTDSDLRAQVFQVLWPPQSEPPAATDVRPG